LDIRGRVLTGGCRKLHIQELYNFNVSPNIIRVKKSRRIKWMGDAAHMGDENWILYLSLKT